MRVPLCHTREPVAPGAPTHHCQLIDSVAEALVGAHDACVDARAALIVLTHCAGLAGKSLYAFVDEWLAARARASRR